MQTADPDLVASVDRINEWVEFNSGEFQISVSSISPSGITFCEVIDPGSFTNSTIVEYYMDPDDLTPDIVYSQESNITNMEVGKVESNNILINDLKKGLYVIRFRVDINDDVPESNDTNNDFAGNILVE